MGSVGVGVGACVLVSGPSECELGEQGCAAQSLPSCSLRKQEALIYHSAGFWGVSAPSEAILGVLVSQSVELGLLNVQVSQASGA